MWWISWIDYQSLLICDSTYLELMNLIKLGKSWNLCLVNTMKFEVINLRMCQFLWIQVTFHAFKTIYLRIKILESYVKNARLKNKTNNVFIIFFPNSDLHFLFLYSTFYSMKESLTAASYQEPSIESFYDSLIRE